MNNIINDTYNVSININPRSAGYATGAGNYERGHSATTTAYAYTGYTFVNWSYYYPSSGGSGTVYGNPYTLTWNQDVVLTANFRINYYTVSVSASPEQAGTVSGGGSYAYGDRATLSASRRIGYEFDHWSNGSTSNPYYLTVTGDTTMIAYFVSRFYNVSVNVSPSGAGRVTGTGRHREGSTATLQVFPERGWRFIKWSDGNTNLSRTVYVDRDINLTVYFEELKFYLVTTSFTPRDGGSVSPELINAGYYEEETIILTARANPNYKLKGWSINGSQTYFTTNPFTYYVGRYIAESEINIRIQAVFELTDPEKTYPVHLRVEPVESPYWGWIEGRIRYLAHGIWIDQSFTVTNEISFNAPEGSRITLTTIINPEITQVAWYGWSDGDQSRNKIIELFRSVDLTAMFTDSVYIVTSKAIPAVGGYVEGAGIYGGGTICTLRAIANEGYIFLRWSDGEIAQTHPPFRVLRNTTINANFGGGGGQFTVKVFASPADYGDVYIDEEGVVEKQVDPSSTVTIVATPREGYWFEKWSNGSKSRIQNIVVEEDFSIVAYFKKKIPKHKAIFDIILRRKKHEEIKIRY